METKLKELTFLTLKTLKRETIILPYKYNKIFHEHAKKLHVDLEDKKSIYEELKQDCESLDNVVKKTNENLNTLQNSTKMAQKAIVDKDEKALNTINDDLQKMQKQIDSLQKELFSDVLTGAYNRRWFMDHYLNEDKFVNDGFMAFIDLNKFKIINDTYGHIVGDQVLKYLVTFLKGELDYSGVDIVRYAGDEFIILFNKDKCSILNVDKKVLEAQKKLSEQILKSSKIKSLRFSFSYGLIPFKKGDDFEVLLDKVDELMYENKKQSRKSSI